ncbi:MAG: 2Fe-2S iron-sulfur cluster-binding protein [Planctomycetaceae bacterium]|nr:2Fe-2S iron-sulfur cluster-binding protein [Planctomycetaceae bacterium]
MIRIIIDNQPLVVPEGTTILEAAHSLGIDIPTLCHRDGIHSTPATSCLACLVKVQGKMVPACATQAADQMVVESETEEIRALRRTSLELLLSDHAGDCFAPCQFACPAGMDIPQMLRFLTAGDFFSAIQVVKQRIALPTTLGRVCPRPCEKICRRKDIDAPVAICQLKRYVADCDLGSSHPFVPEIAPATGKRVVILGAGLTGLAAAYSLCVFGHEVVILEKESFAGGRLRNWDEDTLPKDVLDAEIDAILSLPISIALGNPFEWNSREYWDELHDNFDAIFLATGPISEQDAAGLGLPRGKTGIAVVPGTYQVISTPDFPYDNVFAGGTIVRGPKAMVVRSVADGREAADVIDRFLAESVVEPIVSPFSVRIKKLKKEELDEMAPSGKLIPREEPIDAGTDDFTPDEAANQAARCLHCDCRGREKCRLLRYSQMYGAQTERFREDNTASLKIQRSGDILYEPGKCIKCGLCVSMTQTAMQERKQLLGLSFVGRGFDVKIGVPFDGTLQDALDQVAHQCVEACPTAALMIND